MLPLSLSCLKASESLHLVPGWEVGEAVVPEVQPGEAGQRLEGPRLDLLEAGVGEAEAVHGAAAVKWPLFNHLQELT
jgi:hypothetical protein